MKGIDVSAHNGKIDFKKVKDEGYDFVIIKLGWIGNYDNHALDEKFEINYKNAKIAGLKVGLYIYNYCKSVSTVMDGADWVLNKLKYKNLEMPIFIDMEDKSIISSGKTELTNIAKIFCNKMVENHYKAGVYANKDWFLNKLNIEKLKNFKIWLAEWNGKDKPSVDFKVDLWQYTSKGKVSGITGYVDINKCLECKNINKEEITGEKEEFEMAKKYKNGSTKEDVYSDLKCTMKIGTLNRFEECECLQIVDNRYIVKYKIDNTNNYKVGFVKYSGGVKR